MKTIHIIGLGSGDFEQLPLGLYRRLLNKEQPLYLRTADHPLVETLVNEGITFQTFDETYEKHDQFEAVYADIVDQLTEYAANQSITYAVPGHPMLAEQTVKLLLEKCPDQIEIIGGQSYLDDLFTSLKFDPIEGFSFIDATAFKREELNYHQHLVFCQVYDQWIASEVKLTLMEDLPDDYPITVIDAAGSKQERIITVPLYQLDQTVELSNLTSIYVPKPDASMLKHQFNYLRGVIQRLRAPGGCPWDQKQTHESLRQHLIEEAYELIDAINNQDDEGIIEELGDVLLQVMLHSQVGQDQGYFSIDDVIKTLNEKMIRRHPHVFGDVKVENEEEVHANWQAIKASEKQRAQSILDRIPNASSPILKAEAFQKEIEKTGMDFGSLADRWQAVDEALTACKEIEESTREEQAEKLFGDLLFALINMARYHSIKPALALERSNQYLMNRFQAIEMNAKNKDGSISPQKLKAFFEKKNEQE